MATRQLQWWLRKTVCGSMARRVDLHFDRKYLDTQSTVVNAQVKNKACRKIPQVIAAGGLPANIGRPTTRDSAQNDTIPFQWLPRTRNQRPEASPGGAPGHGY